MKSHTILTAALMLAASTAGVWAQTETASNVAPGNASTTTTAPASSDSTLRSELEQLKALVREQQQRLDALELGRKVTPATPAVPTVVASTAPVAARSAKSQDAAPTLSSAVRVMSRSNVSAVASALDSTPLLPWDRNSAPVSPSPAAISMIRPRQTRP